MSHAPAYPVVTDRLLLRPLDPVTDVDAVHAYQSREDVCRFVPYSPRTREQVADVLADPAIRSRIDVVGQLITLGIVLQEDDRLIGDIILVWHSRVHARGEIGYVLHPDFQGQGYVTEACAALLDYGFAADGLGLHRVVARIDERNTASAAVLRRLGLREEARLVDHEWFKGEWATELHFAILDREWAAHRPSLRQEP